MDNPNQQNNELIKQNNELHSNLLSRIDSITGNYNSKTNNKGKTIIINDSNGNELYSRMEVHMSNITNSFLNRKRKREREQTGLALATSVIINEKEKIKRTLEAEKRVVEKLKKVEKEEKRRLEAERNEKNSTAIAISTHIQEMLQKKRAAAERQKEEEEQRRLEEQRKQNISTAIAISTNFQETKRQRLAAEKEEQRRLAEEEEEEEKRRQNNSTAIAISTHIQEMLQKKRALSESNDEEMLEFIQQAEDGYLKREEEAEQRRLEEQRKQNISTAIAISTNFQETKRLRLEQEEAERLRLEQEEEEQRKQNISTAIAISTHIQEAKLETSDADTVATDSYSGDSFETESDEEEESEQNTHTQIGTATAMAILNSNLIKKTSANNKGGPPPNKTNGKRVIDPNQFKTAVSTAIAIHINNQKDLSSTTGGPTPSRSTSPTPSRSTTSLTGGPPTGGPPTGDLTNDEEGIIAGITAIVMLLIKTIIKQKMGDLIILDESDRKHKQCKQLIEQEYSQYKDDDLKQVIYTSYDNENCYGMLVTKKRTDTGQLIDESIDNIVVPINKLNNSESNGTGNGTEKGTEKGTGNGTGNGTKKGTKKGTENGTNTNATNGANGNGTGNGAKQGAKQDDDKSLQIAVAVTNVFKDRLGNKSVPPVRSSVQVDTGIATSVAIATAAAAVLAK